MMILANELDSWSDCVVIARFRDVAAVGSTAYNYEGRTKSFEPEHIRLQFFSQSIYQ